MNPEVGSIMNFFYQMNKVKVYDEEVPVNFERPSMYFPPPMTFNGVDSNTTYLKTYSLNVKVFHNDSQKAYAAAEKIADAVDSRRNLIPLLNEIGEDTGDFLRIARIEVRVGEMGVATILIQWDSRYFYERETAPPLEDIDINSGVKP